MFTNLRIQKRFIGLDAHQYIKRKVPKHRYIILFGYNGSSYFGSQFISKQSDTQRPTVEGQIFNTITKINGISRENSLDFRKNRFQRSARTDKGVSALGNLISMKLQIEGTTEEFMNKLNSNLPSNIRVWSIQRVNRSFNARKNCDSRWYEYILPTYSLIGSRYHDNNQNETIFDEDSVNIHRNIQMKMVQRFPKPNFDILTRYTSQKDQGTSDNKKLYDNYYAMVFQELNKYRLNPNRLSQFISTMKLYLGSHNFYKFTSGKSSDSRDCQRLIKDMTVSEPYLISAHSNQNSPTTIMEVISIRLHGQSFMLHQIRKMISLTIIFTHFNLDVRQFNNFFHPLDPQEFTIPNIPSLGLMLQYPDFKAYNRRLESLQYDTIDFNKRQTDMAAFKTSTIVPDIIKNESTNYEFVRYLHYLDTSPFVEPFKKL